MVFFEKVSHNSNLITPTYFFKKYHICVSFSNVENTKYKFYVNSSTLTYPHVIYLQMPSAINSQRMIMFMTTPTSVCNANLVVTHALIRPLV